MTASKISDKERELEQFEDALVASIAEASEAELHEIVLAAGENPAAIVQRFDAMLASATAACGMKRLYFVRQEMERFAASAKPLDEVEKDSARKCLANARLNLTKAPEKLLLAARKGQGATERDLDSLAEDYAELERLERESGEEK